MAWMWRWNQVAAQDLHITKKGAQPKDLKRPIRPGRTAYPGLAAYMKEKVIVTVAGRPSRAAILAR